MAVEARMAVSLKTPAFGTQMRFQLMPIIILFEWRILKAIPLGGRQNMAHLDYHKWLNYIIYQFILINNFLEMRLC